MLKGALDYLNSNTETGKSPKLFFHRSRASYKLWPMTTFPARKLQKNSLW